MQNSPLQIFSKPLFHHSLADTKVTESQNNAFNTRHSLRRTPVKMHPDRSLLCLSVCVDGCRSRRYSRATNRRPDLVEFATEMLATADYNRSQSSVSSSVVPILTELPRIIYISGY